VITLPAYRAEETLAKTVADIPHGVADELILVDDASPDNTAARARALGIDVVVTHPQNRGYGGNQKTCYTHALERGADVVVLLHPDYQYDPKAVSPLLAPILTQQADMSFGSRFAGLGDPLAGGMPLYRFVGNRMTTILENVLLGSRFTDLHSGLRAYSRECLLSLPFLRYSNGFSFDSQMLVDAVTSGLRVVEVPISTRYTKESSSISVRRSLEYVGKSLAYCARQSAARGRRGRRSMVANRDLRRRRLAGSGPVSRPCVLCRSHEQTLLYRGNAAGEIVLDEFSCTSGRLAHHDDIVECRGCGMISAVSPVDPLEIVHAYEQVTDERYLTEEEGRRELFSWVLERMSAYVVSGDRLLEIGSNVGLFLDSAARAGWRPRGIEPSRWAVGVGCAEFGVDLRQGTLEDLDEPPRSQDAVVMLDVLEHLIDPLAGLQRLRSVIDQEGLLALSTINVAGIHARIRRERWPWFIRPHLHYFTPETLRTLLEQAGFRPVEWAVVPRSFHMSYVARRAGSCHGALGLAIARASVVFDPMIPFGWLGDVVLVLARPGERESP
jgi:2-polyprenyl-3-methyl-5-hydroxy-6-metoxy-1,4-benzoquinol methylase